MSLAAAFVGSALFSWMFIPEIQRICVKKGLFDSHDERKIHGGEVPRLGGAVFLPAMLLSFLLVLSANILFQTSLFSGFDISSLVEWSLVFSAVILLYLTGLADDLVDVRYRSKLFIQVLAAVLFTASGIWINNLHGLFGIYEMSAMVGIPFTIIVVVCVINAFNFIDGIDGLAAGIAMLAFLFFGITCIYLKLYVISILSFAALGMLIPFFFYNIFGKTSNQSKLFMGDCGSLTIGFLLAAIAVKVYHSASMGFEHSPQALALGFSVLIVPIFDALGVVALRLIRGRSPFKPDRSHMHHKLLDLGFSHKMATLIMLTNAILFGSITICLVPYLNINLILGIVILLWVVLDFVLRRKVNRVLSALPENTKTVKLLHREKKEPARRTTPGTEMEV